MAYGLSMRIRTQITVIPVLTMRPSAGKMDLIHTKQAAFSTDVP